jgi:hypothetical protein
LGFRRRQPRALAQNAQRTKAEIPTATLAQNAQRTEAEIPTATLAQSALRTEAEIPTATAGAERAADRGGDANRDRWRSSL